MCKGGAGFTSTCDHAARYFPTGVARVGMETDGDGDCGDGDVRWVDGFAEIYLDGKFLPILSDHFVDNDDGAKAFCRRLGYAVGRVDPVDIPARSVPGVRVGRCNAGNDIGYCRGGSNYYDVRTGRVAKVSCARGAGTSSCPSAARAENRRGRPAWAAARWAEPYELLHRATVTPTPAIYAILTILKAYGKFRSRSVW